MNTPNHTPGPWTMEQDIANGNDRFILYGRNGGAFGHWQGWSADGVTTDEEDCANAELIAAAPDTASERDHLRKVNAVLLAALRAADAAMRAHPGGDCRSDADRDAAELALAKTEGGGA